MGRRVKKLGQISGDGTSGAEMSPCGMYRYQIWRCWNFGPEARCVLFVCLNPSTADAQEDDYTLGKCVGFAERWEFDGIYVVNLFAYRATESHEMAIAKDPVGPRNDQAIVRAARKCDEIVAAWGGNLSTKDRLRVQWKPRIDHVLNLIKRDMICIGRTEDGSPHHPQPLKYSEPTETFWTPAARH